MIAEKGEAIDGRGRNARRGKVVIAGERGVVDGAGGGHEKGRGRTGNKW